MVIGPSSLRILPLFVAVLALGCTKEISEEDPPPITDYRTYDLVPVAVKEVDDRFALLCKNSPIDRRTAYLQELGADGELGDSISLEALPTRIEDVEFQRGDLLYTDFVHHDGAYIIVGTGRQTDLENRLHLVVQFVAANGATVKEPFRRFLISGSEVGINDTPDLTQDLNGLPRQRVLCAIAEGQLIVAARWETATAAGVRLFRFPLEEGTGPTTWRDIALSGPGDRLHQMACDPGGRTILVTDVMDAGTTRMKVWEYTPSPGEWSNGSSYIVGYPRTEPQQLVYRDGSFFLVGNQPEGNVALDANDPTEPFICRFPDVAGVASGFQVVDAGAQQGQCIASYCSGSWGGSSHLLAQRHEVSATVPYFEGDITSDLRLVDLDASQHVADTLTVIPGQGLRAMGAYEKGGDRIVIGSQHPFKNAGYQHTFYLVLK